MTRDEQNQTIAEALGFHQGKEGGCLWVKGREPAWHHPSCKCEDDERPCTCVSGDEPFGCEYCAEDCAHLHLTECGVDLPDFYTSEEANALVLEAMLSKGFTFEFWPQKDGIIVIARKVVSLPESYEFGRGVVHADRKTAVAGAFLAFIERNGK